MEETEEAWDFDFLLSEVSQALAQDDVQRAALAALKKKESTTQSLKINEKENNTNQITSDTIEGESKGRRNRRRERQIK